ncbi:hypothetical protein [Arcanobacterium haemolyticum]
MIGIPCRSSNLDGKDALLSTAVLAKDTAISKKFSTTN